jgi:predicted RND superfamily exporter protein
MLKQSIKVVVLYRPARLVLAVALILAAVSSAYAERKFAINTDIEKLISPELP